MKVWRNEIGGIRNFNVDCSWFLWCDYDDLGLLFLEIVIVLLLFEGNLEVRFVRLKVFIKTIFIGLLIYFI